MSSLPRLILAAGLGLFVAGRLAALPAFAETFSMLALDPARWTEVGHGGKRHQTPEGLLLQTSARTEFSHASLRTAQDSVFWGENGARYRISFGKNAFVTSDSSRNASIRLYLTGNTTTPTYDQGDANVIWVVLIRQPGPAEVWDLSLWVKTRAPGRQWHESGKPRLYLSNIGSPDRLTLELALREVAEGTAATISCGDHSSETVVLPSLAESFRERTWMTFGYYNGDGGDLEIFGTVAGAAIAPY
ncbi:hypothetical protein IMCC26134_03500 [Verrucomicrobia bacterium IMCC26134]|nr:hypothetical protein IMCC26134_03500 [Verrucomicrobia bacterium IMCC26134]